MHRLRLAVIPIVILFFVQAVQAAPADPRLKNAYRFERAHWVYVHLEGKPAEIGFQHGYLLSAEIADALQAIRYKDTHRTKRDWQFFRDTAEKVLWPHIESEYREELQGIADGLKAKGVPMDVWDVVALNAMEEVPDYYLPTLNRQQKVADAPKLVAPGNCSAFVATGSYTKDHRPVIAHNNWTSVIAGARWRVIFDIVPEHGFRMLTDGFPGIIVSDDDFGINSAGLMVTETTITGFDLYDANGVPEFVRARKALQYADSIDKYVEIMLNGNSGGYANDWLLADTRTGEVARFELGLKLHRVWRTKDGYFVGSNFPSDPELTKKETTFNPNDAGSSPNARHKRWDQLMEENKGKIDIEIAQRFMGDHFDAFQNKEEANERSLCGHVDTSSRGIPEWEWGPFFPGGTVSNQAADADMAMKMTLRARDGFGCGRDFRAAPFLQAHPEYEWMRPAMPDMPGNPWAEFTVSDHEK